MVTSFTCVGMATLRIATFERHWMLRAALLFLIPAPLLLRPAYELYAVFLLQSLLVVAGLIYGRVHARRNSVDEPTIHRAAPRPRYFRFSLSTLLMLMAAVAVVITAAIQLPQWENLAWRTVVVSGFGAATGTLMGTWLYRARRKWIALLLVSVVCIVVGTAVSKLDWFFEATIQMAGWPPRPFTPANFMGSPVNYDDFDAWSFIPLLVAFTTWVLVQLWSAASVRRPSESPKTTSVRRLFARATFAVVAIIFAAIPLAVMIDLLLPPPIPKVAMPEPNAHDDFQRAAKIAGAMDFNFSFSDIHTAPADRLLPFAADADKVDAIVAAGLENRCYVPMDYFSPEGGFSEEQINQYHSIEAALASKARLAVLDRRYSDAVEVYLRATEFGFTASRGAMVEEGRLIRSRAAYGTRGLYFIRNQLSDDLLARCIERLIQIDAGDESMDEALDRYPVWAQRRYGWLGHLKYRLETICVEPGNSLFSDYWYCETFRNHYRGAHAITRLMVCELALIQYHREHAGWPDTLAALVPEYLPAVPMDPFDPQQSQLKYRQWPDGYVLYSVGQNGVDNGGIARAKGERIPGTTGDLRLDVTFSKERW
jgi:hypothetical protein